MVKALIALTLLITLTGCTAWTPIKYIPNKVCDASPSRQDVLAKAFDKATFPHSVRVHCNVQEH